MAEYQDKTKEELLELARERNVEGRSSMNKEELVRALEESDSSDGSSEEPRVLGGDEAPKDEPLPADAEAEDHPTVGDKREAPAASNEGEGEGAPRSADSDVEHFGFASQASDEENEDVTSELSDSGQEALDQMEPKQAELADLALDASGPLILQKPEDRVMTGAVSPEHAKEQEEILGDLPEDHVGHVTEVGSAGPEARQGSGPNGEVVPEDVIDFPPPLEVDEADRREAQADRKSNVVNVATVQTDHAREVFPNDDASGQDRAFNQRAQVYTDGLSGLAESNLPLSYRVNEVTATDAHQSAQEEKAAQQEELAREEESRAGAKEAVSDNEG